MLESDSKFMTGAKVSFSGQAEVAYALANTKRQHHALERDPATTMGGAVWLHNVRPGMHTVSAKTPHDAECVVVPNRDAGVKSIDVPVSAEEMTIVRFRCP